MWYRFAQNNSLSYKLDLNPSKTTVTFTSPMGKDGYPLYPPVNVFLKFDNQIVKMWQKIVNQVETNLKEDVIPKIMEDVLDVFVKYSPGVIPKLTNNTTINIVSDVIVKDLSGKEIAAGYEGGPRGIFIEADSIPHALDHEMGHAMDSKGAGPLSFIPGLQPSFPGGKSHTDYGNTNQNEAIAEAFKLLSEKGINYRFPNYNEDYIRHNFILEYVANKIKSKGISNFKDFSSDIKFDVSKVGDSERDNLNSARLTALVGGFQSAYDRHRGDKNIYIKKLLSDKQVQKDIAAYISKIELPFSITPASNEEIELAVETFKKSSDSIKNNLDNLETNNYSVSKKKPRKQEEYTFIDGGSYLLPKSIKDFLDQNPKLLSEKYIKPEQYANKINASFVNDIRVPVSEKQYLAGSDIVDKFKFKGLPGNYELEQYSFNSILNKLIPQIFPNLVFNNPEDYLFYDFHKGENNSYELDESSVRGKIIQAVDSDKNLKKLSIEKKNKIIEDLMRAMQNYAAKTIKLINVYQTANTNEQLVEFFDKMFNRNNKLSLAKKAVDKLLMKKLPRKNLHFMRIYNSDLNDNEKKLLLNYFNLKNK